MSTPSSPIGKKGDLRIAWDSKGVKGHGEWFDPSQRALLQSHVKSQRQSNPGIAHTIEVKL